MQKNFIGERITSLRLAQGISEYSLSRNIGKCNNYINKISSGAITPSIDTLQSICEYFGISLAQFFDEENQGISLAAARIISRVPELTEEQQRSLLVIIESMLQ